MSDVKLERGLVKVEGQLRVEGTDIHLSIPGRRNGRNRSRDRRAVVHGHDDELILNYADDYKGVQINGAKSSGIRMKGTTYVEGQLKVEGTDIQMNAPSRRDPANTKRYRRALVHGSNDELVINFAKDYNGVKINARPQSGIYLNGPTYVNNVNLTEIIQYLMAERNRLFGAINTLERKARIPVTLSNPPDTDVSRRNIRIPQRFRVGGIT